VFRVFSWIVLPCFDGMINTTKLTVQEMLAAADASSFAWAIDAEPIYRTAITKANQTKDVPSQLEAWLSFGAHLYRRARNRAAVLAYATVWELAEKVEDAHNTTVAAASIFLCLDELPDKKAALAARLCLGELPEAEWAQLPRDLQLQLQDPQSVFKAAIEEIRLGLPDFERKFLAGELHFDQPEDFVDLFTRRARHYQASLLIKARQVEREAYWRQFQRRLIWPALPLIALAVLFALGWLPLGNPIVLVLTLAAVSVYAFFWISSLRAAWQWVSANRKLSELDRSMTEINESRSTHAQGVSILERFAKMREPFVLYLRSFEGEGFQSLTPEGVTSKIARKEAFVENAILSGSSAGGYLEANQMVIASGGGPSSLERYLGTHLSKHVPVITIANPAALGEQTIVPRLEMEHDAWQRAVRLLMSAAHFIVIEPARNSTGVNQELDLTKRSDRHADTIVVLPSEKTRSLMEMTREIMRTGFDQNVGPTTKFLHANDEILKGFPRIVEDDVFGDRDPATLQVLRDVLPDGPTTSPKTYGERRRERSALRAEGTSLHTQGIAHLDRRQTKQANDLFQRAADILGQCGDLAYQAMPLTYQGRAAQALDDLATAESCFASATEIQRETGPPMEYLGSLHHLALVLLERNDNDRARKSFDEMLEASRHWKFPRGEVRAGEGLAMCAFATGDRQGAAELLRTAMKVPADSKDLESPAQMLRAIETQLGGPSTTAAQPGAGDNGVESIADPEANALAGRNEIVMTYNVAVRELERGQVAPAVEKLNQILSRSRALSSKDLEQTILFRLGMAYSRAGQNIAAIDALRQSAELSREREDGAHTALVQSNIGALLIRDDRIPEAIAALREAEKFQRAQGDDGELAYTVDGLGNAYHKQGQYESSLVCDQEALRLHREHNHTDRICVVMERIGMAHLYQDKYAEAKTILLEAASCAADAGNIPQQASDIAISGSLAAKLNDSAEASKLYAQSIALWEALGDEEHAAQVRNLATKEDPPTNAQ
jgi:tetratricopeptide (TPR) repeat protein